MADGIYTRVSTEEQAKSGYSLSEQIRACRSKVRSGYEVFEYADEGISGEFLDRPALIKLRKDVRDGIVDRVICLDPDRLSRKLMNQLIISEELEKKAELVFVNGEYARTPEGMLFYQMRGAVAEFEKAKINERMTRGRREKARQGKVLRDFRVYGYDYDTESEQFTINEYESKVVKVIFELFTNSNNWVKGMNGIAKYLTAQGIPTKRNVAQWHRQVVRQTLLNRAYIGEFYQNKWNTEGMLGNQFREEEEKVRMKQRPKEEWILIPCPPIIKEEQFIQAQKLLEQSRRRWSGVAKNQYLLSGLVRCADCNNTLTGRRTKNWGTYVLEYSDIKNTAGAKNKGCGNRVSCEKLDEMVWETVLEWLKNPDAVAELQDEEEGDQNSFELAEMERIQQELDKIKNGKQRLLNLLMEADLGEEIRDKLKNLKQKEKELTAQRQQYQELLNLQDNKEMSNNIIKEASKFYLSHEDEITFEMKQELLRRVVREIRVNKELKIDIFTF